MPEILLNERDFSPKNFFKPDSPELQTGQTLRIAQDVGYLKFRYHYEISEKAISGDSSGKKSVKVSSEWADKTITEPIDFKSDITDNNNTGTNKESVALPRAVEVSVGLWGPVHPEEGHESQLIELQPFIIPIQVGMLFERFEKEEEDASASEE